jgi:hypothetical protein
LEITGLSRSAAARYRNRRVGHWRQWVPNSPTRNPFGATSFNMSSRSAR